MADITAADRFHPPVAGDEASTLIGFLRLQRDTLRWKCSGLDSAQLELALPPSEITLGGLLKHMSVVEAGWLNQFFAGGVHRPSWLDEMVPDDEDWSFRTARGASPEQLFAWLEESIEVSDRVISDALADDLGLDALSVGEEDGTHVSLRWIICHLIEEYARHNGHADLIRESIDGETGE